MFAFRSTAVFDKPFESLNVDGSPWCRRSLKNSSRQFKTRNVYNHTTWLKSRHITKLFPHRNTKVDLAKACSHKVNRDVKYLEEITPNTFFPGNPLSPNKTHDKQYFHFAISCQPILNVPGILHDFCCFLFLALTLFCRTWSRPHENCFDHSCRFSWIC